MTVWGQAVDQAWQDLAELTSRVALAHAQLRGNVVQGIRAQGAADLVAADSLVIATANPRTHGITQAGLLKLSRQTAQSALAAIVTQHADSHVDQLRVHAAATLLATKHGA